MAALAIRSSSPPARRRFWHRHSSRCGFRYRRANVCRRFDLRFIRIDKQGDRCRHPPRDRHRASCRAGRRRPARLRWSLPDASPAPQQKCGLVSQAIVSISSVTAISRFMRVCSVWRRIRTSRSVIWRRSSRRCTVMPSAPACSAMKAA